MKFEYKIEVFDLGEYDWQESANILTGYGKEGWELISCNKDSKRFQSKSENYYYFFFKRIIND